MPDLPFTFRPATDDEIMDIPLGRGKVDLTKWDNDRLAQSLEDRARSKQLRVQIVLEAQRRLVACGHAELGNTLVAAFDQLRALMPTELADRAAAILREEA